jgi:hypothetical protein
MDRDELVRKMRGRVEQCRRLARSTTDARTALILNQMADEGEADIRRIFAEADLQPRAFDQVPTLESDPATLPS